MTLNELRLYGLGLIAAFAFIFIILEKIFPYNKGL
jgi:hypothetical protein